MTCDKLRCMNYQCGDKIVLEGDEVMFFQIIVNGTAEGRKYDANENKEVVVKNYKAKKSAANYFGAKEIQLNVKQPFTIEVTSKKLKSYALSSRLFKELMEQVNNTVSAESKAREQQKRRHERDERKGNDYDDNNKIDSSSSPSSSLASSSPLRSPAIEEEEEDGKEKEKEEEEEEEKWNSIDDDEHKDEPSKPFVNQIDCSLEKLKVIGILGVGAYGTVSLVEDPNTGITYSLKKIRKNKVIETRQEKHVQNERNILANLNNNFCVQLFATYQDRLHVYLLMEPVLGGELFYLLRFNKRFDEVVAKFYASCVVCAFEYIHAKQLIFRDLKPENLLLANNGYCKLIDFGFAKKLDDSSSLCGTPEYLPPETIRCWTQKATVDWWALGIFIYEMLFGRPPFREDAHVKMYEKILTSPVEFPERPKISSQAQDIIVSLLEKQSHKRLGSGRHATADVKKHPWFQTVDWEKTASQQLHAPYIPRIDNNKDLRNFVFLHVEDCDEDLFDDPTGELYQWCDDF
ncbi:hypothetical protein RFI_05326 [Reticulomyxa filosa]|uniref:cGMP-dependent protein kinase n=1 Tax=Reticulomyxa filosa TaxID=46433 RepID=X6P0Y2_RETFI|nr:hypothetical protein RFI_05326 [Reticulomyxa filosa]|eukprot:ETO31793.1 hypothetical protein RFI_05326 [Reticulomyxa filosa]